jgi:sugar phosphate isomerase/epimerase
MKLSCCIWALDREWGGSDLEPEKLQRVFELGFKSIDVCPSNQTSERAKSALTALGLEISCVSLSHEAPEESTFDSEDMNHVHSLVHHTNTALDYASDIGAGCAYVVPGPPIDKRTKSRYADKYAALAERGQKLGVKMCIEHFPKTAFPTVASTLEFIKGVDHPNLYLLFDIGHAQMTNEDPAKVLPLAGDRLGYVHLDDNDGVDDLHLALTDGVQTDESLNVFFRVLEDVGYTGPVSLEMKQNLPDPLEAIRRSKEIVGRLIEVE